MKLLRRITPFFAAALALVITVEVTDVLRCADEVRLAMLDQPVEDAHSGEHDAVHGHHGPVNESHRSEHLPDCLCHVVFVPTAALPEVGAPTVVAFHYPTYVGEVTEADVPPPGHVPIG